MTFRTSDRRQIHLGATSTRDYQEVIGENPVTAGRPNPLDAVIPPEPQILDKDGD